MKKVENCLKKGCQGCHISKSCPGNFDLHTSNSSIYHPCSWGNVKIHWNESDPRNEQCHGSSPRIMGRLLLALSQHECRVTFWSSTTARFLQSSVSPEERGVMWGKISEMRCGITGKDSNKPERRWRMGLPSCGRQIRFFCDSLVSRERACSGREKKEKGIPLFSIDPKGESRDFKK